MTTRIHLTDTAIRAALAKAKPGDARLELTDDVPPFVRVRVSHGLAAFYWIGRNPTTRKTERHKLGIAPAMTVRMARDAANAVKGAAHAGTNIAKAKRERKRTTDGGRATVRDLANAYIARCAADGKPLAPGTVRNYTHTLAHLLGEYMDRPMDALDDDTMQELVRDRMKRRIVKTKYGRPSKRGSEGGVLIGVKCLTRLCNVNRLPNPAQALRTDKRLPTAKVRVGRLGTIEGQQLVAWLMDYAQRSDTPEYKARCARMMVTAVVTGWRISTVERWQWEHIDWRAMTTQLPENKMQYRQVLPLWPMLADMLKPMQQKSGPVFGKWVANFPAELPWPVSPHDGRKALSAVLLNIPGAPPLAVKLLMAHFDDVTIKHYLLVTPPADQVRALRPVVKAVSDFYSAKVGHMPTVRALNPLADARFAASKVARSKRSADQWAAKSAQYRAKRAAA